MCLLKSPIVKQWNEVYVSIITSNHAMSHDGNWRQNNPWFSTICWTSATSWRLWRCSAVRNKTACKCFFWFNFSSYVRFFVDFWVEMNIDISNELNFSAVYRRISYIGSLAKFTWTPNYRSINYIGSLAKFTWTRSGFIHFARDSM